jgi:hypothetical protein
MKTLNLLFFAILLFAVSCSKTDDFPEENNGNIQLKSADTRTMNFHFTSGEWYSPLYCGDEFIDNLVGNDETLNGHGVVHFVDGKAKWAHVLVKGTVIRESTGEIFKINELNKLTFDENEDYLSHTCRTHAKGNMGTNVIMFYTIIDFDAGEIVMDKAICASN